METRLFFALLVSLLALASASKENQTTTQSTGGWVNSVEIPA